MLFVIDGGTGRRKALRDTCGALAVVQRVHPGAAASLRECRHETLTLQRLGVTGALYRNLNGLVGRFVRKEVA
jgi:hypothetical protein